MWLTREQAQTIIAYARAESPYEACGIIAGQRNHVLEIIPIPNTAADPLHNYTMDERRLVEVLISLEARSVDLISFYHSHPQTDPIPSPTDVKLAFYPDTPYLIISLKGGEARLAAWKMHYGQVSAEILHIGEQPPSSSDSPTLSRAQKIAILMSALIAFILLIVLSLSLLPPAPLIPR